MTCSLKDLARSIARASKRSEAEVLNYHLLEGVLKRVSQSNYANSLILRGGMLTRLWVAIDLDFLGLYPFDIEVTLRKFQEILHPCQQADEIVFDLDSLAVKGIWLNTEFPGVRVNTNAVIGDYQNNIQIDIGFNDPLTRGLQWIDYPLLLTPVPRVIDVALSKYMRRIKKMVKVATCCHLHPPPLILDGLV